MSKAALARNMAVPQTIHAATEPAMQIIQYDYRHKPGRFYVDGRRVSAEAMEHLLIAARMRGRMHSCFLTVRRKTPSGQEYYVHYSQLG